MLEDIMVHIWVAFMPQPPVPWNDTSHDTNFIDKLVGKKNSAHTGGGGVGAGEGRGGGLKS